LIRHTSAPVQATKMSGAKRMHQTGDDTPPQQRGGDEQRSAPESFGLSPRALAYLERGNRLAVAARYDDAIQAFHNAIASAPDFAEAFNNLGSAHYLSGNSEAAAAAYQKALSLGLDNATVFYNLGTCLRDLGRQDQALEAFRQAIRRSPLHAGAHNNLGNVLRDLGRFTEAAEAYSTAVDQQPDFTDAHHNLAAAVSLVLESDPMVARQITKRWHSRHSDNPVARHVAAAVLGMAVPEQAAAEYVGALFDRFADSFDQTLDKLRYRLPELVAAHLQRLVPEGEPLPAWRILDAGCGTGLCAPALRPYAAHLTGVDLSAGMLERARSVGAYDQLEQAELMSFLRSKDACYELVLAADVFCYFGRLEAVLQSIGRSLGPDGYLFFSVETLDGSTETAHGVHLAQSGRYKHSRDYVREAIYSAGMYLNVIDACVLRQENGQPVHGLFFQARCLRNEA